MSNAVLAKVLSTGVSFVVTFFVGIIVPRIVGPESYGSYAYLIATYLFLFQLFLFGLNTAYVYFLSDGKYSIGSVNGSFFILYCFVVLIVGLVGLGAYFLPVRLLWGDDFSFTFVLIGFLFSLMANVQLRIIEFGDSTGYSVGFEFVRLAAKVLLLLLLVILVFKDWLDISNFLWAQVASLSCFLGFIYARYNRVFQFQLSNVYRRLLLDVALYVKPMIAFTLLAAFYSYMGKFMLQSYSGSEEQGIYQACFQLVLIPVAFLTSLTNIFLNKMVALFKNGLKIGVASYFAGWVVRLYLMHALFSGILVFFPGEVLLLVFGPEYSGGREVVQYLAIFSLLHVFGLLSANLFYCSARNKLYSIINGATMVVGVCVLVMISFFYGLTAEVLAGLMAFFYGIRVFVQMAVNVAYFDVKVFALAAQLGLVTTLYIGYFSLSRAYLDNIILVVSLSPIALLLANYLLGDALRIGHVWAQLVRRLTQ